MATIKDVAKLAKVSTATVSAVINNSAYVSPDLKDRVNRAIAELGYMTDGIARSLKKGVTNLLGLIVDDMTAPFYMSLVEEIEACAYARGYSLLLCHSGRDVAKERKYINLLRTHRVDGIIWSPTGRAEDYPAAEFERFPIPIVFVDRVVSTFQSHDSVLLNNRSAGRLATDYLLDLGHRRIAMITGTEHLMPATERCEGFREAFLRRGLRVDPQFIRHGKFREAETFEECKKLFAENLSITAIVVGSDQMFVGVMRALDQFRLRCPADISIVTIDDFPLAGVFKPAVTAVRQPVREMAQEAVDLLLRWLATPANEIYAPTHKIVESRLIVRESCAPWDQEKRTVQAAEEATPKRVAPDRRPAQANGVRSLRRGHTSHPG